MLDRSISLQSSVSGVAVSLLVLGLMIDILHITDSWFSVKLMLSRFLHLWFLLSGCFIRPKNVTCLL